MSSLYSKAGISLAEFPKDTPHINHAKLGLSHNFYKFYTCLQVI